MASRDWRQPLSLFILQDGANDTCVNATAQNCTVSSSPPRLIGSPWFILEIVVTIAVLGFVLAVLHFRLGERARAIAELPRSKLPLDKKDQPKHILAAIREETERHYFVKVVPDPEIDGCPAGWGKPGQDQNYTDLKESIARSHGVLELAAIHSDPRLARAPTQTVRDYVQYLESRCRSLRNRGRLCAYYVSMYEKARFSQEEIEMTEYLDFMKHFFALIQALSDSDVPEDVS